MTWEHTNVTPLPSARDFVVRRLRDKLCRSELAPGQRLDLDAIASESGVSRTPVREACALLSIEGLVDVVPRVGVFVRRIPLREVLDVYTVKRDLEPLAAAWATTRAPEQDRTAWADRCAFVHKAADAGDFVQYAAIVDARRNELLAMTDSPVLIQQFAVLDNRLRLFNAQNLSQAGTLHVSAAQHQRVADAVREGVPDRAYAAMADHVADAMGRITRLWATTYELADAGPPRPSSIAKQPGQCNVQRTRAHSG